ncbi:MAG: DUF418 domain-containing protein [Acidobacteria bacterium]|nr:DUF418 domain-containing protein [Acidobacteriota bacterium]
MENIEPVRQSERIASIDTLRGFSLLGILLLNIASFGLPFAAYMNPTVYGGATGADLNVWLIATTLFDGKMRCIFSMLFGAGAVILLRRAERRGIGIAAADIYYRRTMWLILIGLLHAHLIWSGDILYGYGVVGLLLFPLRRLSAKALIITGAVIILIHSLQGVGAGLGIRELRDKALAAEKASAPSEEQKKAIQEWKQIGEMFEPAKAEVDKQVLAHRGGWMENLPIRSAEAAMFEFTMFFQFLFLDVLGMLIMGMGLSKAGVFDASRSNTFYAVFSLAGFAVGAPLHYWAAKSWMADGFTAPGYFSYLGSTADLGRFAVAMGYTGLVMLACKANFSAITSPLAAVGRMALSNYLLTSILCTLFFNGYGLGFFGKLQRHELYYVVFGMWTINLIVSPIWLRYFRFGPAEWLWRSLTYWEKQPMRRGGRLPAAIMEATS